MVYLAPELYMGYTGLVYSVQIQINVNINKR